MTGTTAFGILPHGPGDAGMRRIDTLFFEVGFTTTLRLPLTSSPLSAVCGEGRSWRLPALLAVVRNAVVERMLDMCS